MRGRVHPVLVTLTPHTMYGKLCTPAGARTVAVLVPGGTYNSSYWDIAYTPEVRSFRLAMNKAGIATMTVDRLGTGKSSKPLSALLTDVTQASAVHQVISTMRPRFDKVVIGGHSVGSGITMIEAGTYRDVDGVLITGLTHRMNYLTALPQLAKMYPAPLDPQTALRGLDVGYLTTMPGMRYDTFHVPGVRVPDAMSYDESTKDVMSVGEAITTVVMTSIIIPSTRRVNAPVMTVVSSLDHFCGTPPLGSDCSSPEALIASEREFYPQAPRMDAHILTNYGHSFNYSPDPTAYHAAVVAWARSLG